MLEPQQLIEVGKILKLHGLNGEMTALVTDPVFDDVFTRMTSSRKKSDPYLVIEIDGIFVPFFVSAYRFRSESSMLITFDDISTQERASEFCGSTLYFDRRCFTKREAEEYDAISIEEESLIGYTIIDTTLGVLGNIIDIDAQTANVLFVVERNCGEENSGKQAAMSNDSNGNKAAISNGNKAAISNGNKAAISNGNKAAISNGNKAAISNDNKAAISNAEILIPAADDLIINIDDDAKTITMNLPQGLVNLDEAEEE